MLKVFSLSLVLFTIATNIYAIELCDDEFSNLYKQEELSNIESKLNRWGALSEKCAGTGLYESRLGHLYYEAQQYEKSKTIIENGLKLKSEFDKELLFGLADTEAMLGDLNTSLDIANQLVNQYGNWYGGYQILGRIYAHQQRFNLAIDAYEKSNSLEELAGTYSALVICYYHKNDHEKAITAMQKAIKLDNTQLAQRLAVPAAAYSLTELGYLDAAEDLLIQHQSVRPESKDDPVFARTVIHLQKKMDEKKSD